MECKIVMKRLYEFIYDELDKTLCDEMEEHLCHCEGCKSEYEKLKKLLIDDAKILWDYSKTIEAPEGLMSEVRASVRRKTVYKPIKYLTAACLMLVFLYTAPVFAYYAGQIFPFERYTGFLDQNTIKDFKEGRGQVIGKSSVLNGVTFTIDGMIKKGDTYNILFTIKVPECKDYNYGFPVSDAITVQDQFGKTYRVGSASGTTARAEKAGESQYIFEIAEPISFWSYKLKVRLTAIELGYTNEKEDRYFEKYKNVYGDWMVDFKINRAIDRR